MQIIIKFKLISLLNYATNKTKNKESPQQFWLKTARSYNLLFAFIIFGFMRCSNNLAGIESAIQVLSYMPSMQDSLNMT